MITVGVGLGGDQRAEDQVRTNKIPPALGGLLNQDIISGS